MVDVIGKAKVVIVGDVDSRSIDQAGSKIGSSLKKGAVIGVAALGTVAVAGVKAFQAFEEAEAQTAKLSTVLGNMGKSGALESVEKLSNALMRQTGVDDEVIKGGQTILATFSQVAESAGEVGGTFERATKAALDMSSAGFGSVESASVMLGKALQDPVKGVTALGRAGVTFTAEQKELIKSLVETGDAGKAQALILAEVEKQVGGTATASSTESAKISAAMGEIQESAGAALNVLLGGEEGRPLSDVLFDVADQIQKMAESEDFKTLSADIRETAEALLPLARYMARALKYGSALANATPGWGSKWKLFTPPIVVAAMAVERLVEGLEKLNDLLNGDLKGDSGLVLLNEGNTSFGDSDFISQITGNASGGRSLTSGWSVVGEEGPEIIKVPSGSDIYSNAESQAMVGSAGNTTVFNITGPVSLAELRQRAAWYDTYGTRFGT